MTDRERRQSHMPQDFQKLYQNTPMMMHSIGPEGRLLAVSDHWLETLGYRRDEVIGRKLTDFFTAKSRDLAEETVLPRFFEIGSVKEIPYQMVKKNGELIDVLISAKSERGEDGKVLHSMAAIVDVTERKKAEEEVQRLAHFDILTGQPNRYLLQERLHHALVQAQRDESKVGVLFVDLDHFKWVNDTLGHAAGDQLLIKVARKLQGCVRQGDTVARLGGDEFVIVLQGVGSDEELPHFAQRFIEVLSTPINLGGVEVMNSASIGIAIYPLDGKDVDTLLRNADTAMYVAKDHGRNNYQFFSDEINLKASARLGLESHMRRALKEDEFFLVYQPQIDIRTNRICGVEALIRWHNPISGLINPREFVGVAESSGLIYPLGEWVLSMACAQAKAWQDLGIPKLRMAVNVSITQFRRHDFIDMIEDKLETSGLDPECLEIELTESVIMDDIKQGLERLTDLKVRKIKLAIDDFGTGYSSLVYLKHFPFDRLKIAQEFVHDIPKDPEAMAIVEAILAIAEKLNLGVIAEGVENRSQLDYLSATRCNEMQGFYFSPPLTAQEMTSRLLSGSFHVAS
ncbi:MAG: EAL domain-containing protein [Deltaproteobacteria bacterium]|jgi:diguanylate cyclase (GGDEF)-like protein/PAS domain S-box-containing protein|nr:EAL domain-containing protein [Deltaproteobacteria bacterium]